MPLYNELAAFVPPPPPLTGGGCGNIPCQWPLQSSNIPSLDKNRAFREFVHIIYQSYKRDVAAGLSLQDPSHPPRYVNFSTYAYCLKHFVLHVDPSNPTQLSTDPEHPVKYDSMVGVNEDHVDGNLPILKGVITASDLAQMTKGYLSEVAALFAHYYLSRQLALVAGYIIDTSRAFFNYDPFDTISNEQFNRFFYAGGDFPSDRARRIAEVIRPESDLPCIFIELRDQMMSHQFLLPNSGPLGPMQPISGGGWSAVPNDYKTMLAQTLDPFKPIGDRPVAGGSALNRKFNLTSKLFRYDFTETLIALRNTWSSASPQFIANNMFSTPADTAAKAEDCRTVIYETGLSQWIVKSKHILEETNCFLKAVDPNIPIEELCSYVSVMATGNGTGTLGLLGLSNLGLSLFNYNFLPPQEPFIIPRTATGGAIDIRTEYAVRPSQSCSLKVQAGQFVHISGWGFDMDDTPPPPPPSQAAARRKPTLFDINASSPITNNTFDSQIRLKGFHQHPAFYTDDRIQNLVTSTPPHTLANGSTFQSTELRSVDGLTILDTKYDYFSPAGVNTATFFGNLHDLTFHEDTIPKSTANSGQPNEISLLINQTSGFDPGSTQDPFDEVFTLVIVTREVHVPPIVIKAGANTLYDDDKFEMTIAKVNQLINSSSQSQFSALVALINVPWDGSSAPIFHVQLAGHYVGRPITASTGSGGSGIVADENYRLITYFVGLPANQYESDSAVGHETEYAKVRYSYASIRVDLPKPIILPRPIITFIIDSFVSPLRSRLDKHFGEDFRVGTGQPSELTGKGNPPDIALMNYSPSHTENYTLDKAIYKIFNDADNPNDPVTYFGYNQPLSLLRSMGLLEGLAARIVYEANSSNLNNDAWENLRRMLHHADTKVIDKTAEDRPATVDFPSAVPANKAISSINYDVYHAFKWYWKYMGNATTHISISSVSDDGGNAQLNLGGPHPFEVGNRVFVKGFTINTGYIGLQLIIAVNGNSITIQEGFTGSEMTGEAHHYDFYQYYDEDIQFPQPI